MSLIRGDARHIPLADETVQCIVTSPPYWGLRDYGLATWEGGDIACDHRVGRFEYPVSNKQASNNGSAGHQAHDICPKCGARRSEPGIGLEPTLEEYVANIVQVFREVRRVLRDDGTLWLNLGSAYSSGGPTLAEALGRLLKSALVVIVDGIAVTSSGQRVDVAPSDEGGPEFELASLLGPQGHGLEKRNEDFRQVLHLLAYPGDGGGGSASGRMEVNAPNSQMITKHPKGWKIIGANGNSEAEAKLMVLGSASTGAGEDDERSLSVNKANNPSVHGIVVWETRWNAFALHSGLEGLPDVDLVNQPIPLAHGLGAFACPLRHFRVTKAGEQELLFSAIEVGLSLSISAVGHCRFLMSDGSIIPYRTLLAQAIRICNAEAQKQDLVIPWRVAMALQEDGWILRAPIIWAKLNPMPESVRDRPTRSHEYLFLLSKSARYYYDAVGISEPISPKTLTVHTTPRKGDGTESTGEKINKWMEEHGGRYHPATRNRRSVWTIPTQPYRGAHFATFPEKLVEPCILAGTKPGDLVLDPFCGSGTVGAVSRRLGRRFVGIDLSAKYLELARQRIFAVPEGMPL